MKKEKIMVTGANGFLGKSVCRQIKKNKDYKLIPLSGKAEWDLTKQKYVDYALSEFNPDVVIHLAG